MPDDFKYDVFLSHSAKDKLLVRAIAERLRNDGLKVWFDEWEIRVGDSIPAKIEEGLTQSRALVLCMSANAFGSDWAQLESYAFRFRDPLNKRRRFIPLRLDKAPPQGSLAQFSYLDFQQDPDSALRALLETCRSKEPGKFGIHEPHPEPRLPNRRVVRPDDSWTEYELHCPSDFAQARQAMEIGRAFYGPYAISFDQFRDWMKANQYVLVSLTNQNGDVVGYFDILPLKADAFNKLIAGEIDEHDLRGEDILPPKDALDAERLYFAGIAARGIGNLGSSRNASVLIRKVFRFVEDFYPPDHRRELYALAATDEGAGLLNKLGFEAVFPAEKRKDKCDLYRYEITHRSLKAALARFKRMDGLCRVKWKRPLPSK